MQPSIGVYDVILVNSSAGKDSLAMLDYVVGLATEAGVLDRVVVVHSDLGRVEWKGTRELAERQAARYGVRFEVVTRVDRQGDLLTHVEQRGKWPSPTNRYCTSDHKRGQIQRCITKLSREVQAEQGKGYTVRILNCLGMRSQESPARAKLKAYEHNKRASSQTRIVMNWLPVHDWTEAQVWDRIRSRDLEYHPAYDLGMPRLSCVFCIFAPKRALVLAGKHNRELLEEYVAVEQRIGHTFRQDTTMADVKAAVDADEAVGDVGDGAWNM